jgi:hypothetical protein
MQPANLQLQETISDLDALGVTVDDIGHVIGNHGVCAFFQLRGKRIGAKGHDASEVIDYVKTILDAKS